MHIIGEVEGRICVLMDDLVDTANTLCQAADALHAHGATRVMAYCTHAVLSGRAIERVNQSALQELVVSDTIPLNDGAASCGKIRQVSVAELLAESMRRISDEDSVSTLFMD
jgi:ribose-phosphate pyrophosphokinase